MKKALTSVLVVMLVAFCLFATANSLITSGLIGGMITASAEETEQNEKSYYKKQKAIHTATELKIGDDTVEVNILGVIKDDVLHNPTFVQLELVNNSIKYKKLHPEENVNISVASFHFSAIAAGCLDTSNPNYGKMRSVYTDGYDSDGYVTLVYLLVEAAKIGINVRVMGQLDGAGGPNGDIPFDAYFSERLNMPCADNLPGKRVGDYLKCVRTEWTSYNDRAPSDMMHLKAFYVSHFIDMDGVEKKNAVVLTSQNIDGILENGVNGNNSLQTGVRIVNHTKISQALLNYIDLIFEYCGQEDVYAFRKTVIERNEKQYAMIMNGDEASIPKDEQILYLGSSDDRYFEMYFTPLGGAVGAWDTDFNPYAKYTSKMLNSEDYVEFSYMNGKMVESPFTQTMVSVVKKSFIDANSPRSKLFLTKAMNDVDDFSELVEGENLYKKTVGNGYYHTKDILVSYVKGGLRQYVTVHASTNMHEGALWYQANSMLVIKEQEGKKSDVFDGFSDLFTDANVYMIGINAFIEGGGGVAFISIGIVIIAAVTVIIIHLRSKRKNKKS